PDHIRPRVCSLPEKAYNPRLSDDLYRLRTFSITNKGSVVNCGDSIINRRSRSNTSVNSTTSKASNVSGERSPFDGSCCGSGYHTVDSTPLGSPEEAEVPKYRVVMLGDSGVGKTALVSQFMTSEYMNTYDASLDDEFGERTVSILLDGEESEMIFIDHPASEMSVENSLSTYEPHACIVIYSIVARPSFQHAEETLNYLWREGYTQDKSVIVVGNKSDLARSRVISSNDGKALAVSRDCKFIETSSGIQHNVDELLVGILKQIRLRETRDKKKTTTKNKLHGSKTSLSLNIAREILQKIYDYDKVHKKLIECEITSDIQSDSEQPLTRRKHFLPQRYIDSEDEEPQTSSQLSLPPKVRRLNLLSADDGQEKFQLNGTLMAVTRNRNLTQINKSSPQTFNCDTPKSTASRTLHSLNISEDLIHRLISIQEICLTAVTHVKEENKQILNYLTQQKEKHSSPFPVLPELPTQLPISTEQDLIGLNQLLTESPDTNSALSTYLGTLGGKDITNKTNRILKPNKSLVEARPRTTQRIVKHKLKETVGHRQLLRRVAASVQSELIPLHSKKPIFISETSVLPVIETYSNDNPNIDKQFKTYAPLYHY
ncbi:hypothetical protein RN001_002184, partial [Aquatica leii]